MSSGVSDQMKVPGSTGKNLEQRNIPWSQQVDEASYENLASPANDDNSVANNSSMQFQYPPFNAKESLNNPWNNFNKPRKSSNFENNKNFGKSENYNNGKRDDFQPSAWGRRPPPPSSDNSGSYNNRSGQQQQNNRYDDGYGGAGGKLDANNKSSAANNMAIEQNRKTNTMASVAAPKKTTYAWIISQPVPTSRTTLITSSHKKKGPGMPPPPMVPGKHNLDVNIWDLPNNNPPPVPSPPPPLDLSQIDGNSSDSMAGGPVSNMFRHDLAGRPDKITNHKTTTNTNNNNDYMRDNDNKSNYSNSNNNNNNNNHSNNSNYGRGRSPTNGHGRKAWQNAPQTLMPAAQQQPMPGGRSIVGSGGTNTASGPNIMRRSINDNTNISSGGGGGRNYTGYRKPEPRPFNAGGQSSRGGSESESAPYNNYRDENNPRNYDQNVQQQQQHHHHQPPPQQQQQAQQPQQQPGGPTLTEVDKVSAESVLEELRMKNTYNPLKLDLEMAKMARFFVIKSYSEDDIHRSIKYELWCSTDHGNQRLDEAFKERQEKGGHVLLFFSVNSSRHFCGMAQMKTAVDYNCKLDVWSQDKWKGIFQVKWIYVKDVPNGHLRHIRLENNENKSVTHSRDVQEVPNARGIEVLQIMHSFKNMTSIFDDFHHYEKKQEEEGSARTLSHYENINQAAAAAAAAASSTSSHNQRHYGRQPLHSNDDRDGRDSRDSRGGMGQKYFSNGPNGGGGGGFRDRNNSMIHRGNNGGGGGFYGEQRRYDNHRNHMTDGGDKEQQRDEFANNNNNNRYAQKFDSNRRLDERNPFKQQQQQQQQPQQHNNNNNNNNNRDKDRDFSEDKQNSNNEARF